MPERTPGSRFRSVGSGTRCASVRTMPHLAQSILLEPLRGAIPPSRPTPVPEAPPPAEPVTPDSPNQPEPNLPSYEDEPPVRTVD